MFRRLFGRARAKAGERIEPNFSLVTLLANSARTSAGVRVTPDIALQVTTVMRCVALLAEMTATLPLVLYRRTADGRGREPAEDHAIYDLVARQPNRWMTPFEFKRHLMIHSALRGNGYAFVPRDRAGRPLELLPLHSDRTRALRTPDGGRAYDVQLAPNEPTLRVSDLNVLHTMWMSQDGYVGMKPVALAAEAIGLALAAQDHGARFFGDGAVPPAVLVVKGNIKPEEADRLAERWNRLHGGTNRQRIGVLTNDAKLEKISVTPEEAQFLQTRQFQVADIARIFGIPPFLLNDMQRATSWGTGLEQQKQGFVEFTLMPWLVMMEQAFERALLMPDERRNHFFKFNVNALLRGDALTRSRVYEIGIRNRYLTPNEARIKEDLNPLPGLDAIQFDMPGTPSGAPQSPEQPQGDRPADDEAPKETDDAQT